MRSASRRRRGAVSRWPVWLAAALVVLVALAAFLPWATEPRRALTGTPVPPPFRLITPVAVAPGGELCIDDVALETDSARAVFRTATVRGLTPAAVVRVRGEGGYAAVGRAPGGLGSHVELAAAFAPPPRSMFATVCLRNAGRRTLPVQGTREARVATRSTTTLDGRRIAPRVTLAVAQARDRSLASRPGEILAHASAFSLPRPLLALLALLVGAGVPLATVAALSAALREDGAAPRDRHDGGGGLGAR